MRAEWYGLSVQADRNGCVGTTTYSERGNGLENEVTRENNPVLAFSGKNGVNFGNGFVLPRPEEAKMKPKRPQHLVELVIGKIFCPI